MTLTASQLDALAEILRDSERALDEDKPADAMTRRLLRDDLRDFARDLDILARVTRAPIAYLCHPVSGDVQGNIARALRWLEYMRRSEPEVATVAPWIAGLLSGEDDDNPNARARAIRECAAMAARCDRVILCGGRVSAGMAIERDACVAAGGSVVDLTHLGEEPPAPVSVLAFTAPDRTEES